jgi:UDP-N-acetylglucosamine 2-epimerase
LLSKESGDSLNYKREINYSRLLTSEIQGHFGMRVISLVGARPQFIKEAILHRQFLERGIDEILVNSGQHYDVKMSDVFFEGLEIAPPAYNLGVGSGSHTAMTAKVMVEFEKVVAEEMPDLVVVYGDTNTTLAGALVAAKMKVPVAHIEAGVRMLPKSMPEEINRSLTDKISRLLFCSSVACVNNLAREGIREGVLFSGDVMYDLFLLMKPRFSMELMQTLKLEPGLFVLMTLHRDYNVDDPGRLREILTSVGDLARNIKVVFPIHPRTKKRVSEFGLQSLLQDVCLVDPLDYLTLMGLTTQCAYVLTDSGGLQKESYFAGKRAFLFMPDPAWHELVDEGVNELVEGRELCALVNNNSAVTCRSGIYGNGDAGRRIVDQILKLR